MGQPKMLELGKNMPKNYKTIYRGGKTRKNQEYYCKCGKKCSRAGRCKSCANRDRRGTYHMSEEGIKNSHKWQKTKSKDEMEKIYKKIALKNKGKVGWSKGKTKETDERILRISLKNKGRIITQETKIKLSKSLKEVPRTKEWRENIRKARIKEYSLWRRSPMLGKHHNVETKRKIRENTAWIPRDRLGKFVHGNLNNRINQ